MVGKFWEALFGSRTKSLRGDRKLWVIPFLSKNSPNWWQFPGRSRPPIGSFHKRQKRFVWQNWRERNKFPDFCCELWATPFSCVHLRGHYPLGVQKFAQDPLVPAARYFSTGGPAFIQVQAGAEGAFQRALSVSRKEYLSSSAKNFPPGFKCNFSLESLNDDAAKVSFARALCVSRGSLGSCKVSSRRFLGPVPRLVPFRVYNILGGGLLSSLSLVSALQKFERLMSVRDPSHVAPAIPIFPPRDFFWPAPGLCLSPFKGFKPLSLQPDILSPRFCGPTRLLGACFQLFGHFLPGVYVFQLPAPLWGAHFRAFV